MAVPQLPVELLSLIIEHLTSIKDLFAIRLTSRTAKDVVTPRAFYALSLELPGGYIRVLHRLSYEFAHLAVHLKFVSLVVLANGREDGLSE
jgi:hypothetical protein